MIAQEYKDNLKPYYKQFGENLVTIIRLTKQDGSYQMTDDEASHIVGSQLQIAANDMN